MTEVYELQAVGKGNKRSVLSAERRRGKWNLLWQLYKAIRLRLRQGSSDAPAFLFIKTMNCRHLCNGVERSTLSRRLWVHLCVFCLLFCF